jgi:hypothetical protein
MKLLIAIAFLAGAAATLHDGLEPSRQPTSGPPPPPPPPNPALVKLEKKYNATRLAACAKVTAKAPTLNAADAAAFMTAYQGFLGNTSEAPVLAAAKKLMTPALDAFLSLPDSFSADGLDANMVTCALMTEAVRGQKVGRTYEGCLLSNFALKGAAEEALVDKLLADPVLMKDMLVAGGIEDFHEAGLYGEAMEIYTGITKASSALRATIVASAASGTEWDSRDPANILKRLAVGTALAHANPIASRNGSAYVGPKYIDPVGRYLHYEKYYQAGDLDPAFPILTSFELQHTVNVRSIEDDLTWLRSTLMNFRPDDIAIDYHNRYIESVHTEVAYGDSHCKEFNNGTGWDKNTSKWVPGGVCDGTYKDIPVGGDVCGGRAFWGRFASKGFGRPTWGATEHGHAAMSAWTPTGWVVLLGAPWPDCWWGPRGGEDFYLETQARANTIEFQKVLRAGWVARAQNEEPVNGEWHVKANPGDKANGKGGLWSALTLYMKKSVRDSSPPMNITALVPSGPTEAPHNKVDELLTAWPTKTKPLAPPAAITTSADGTITVPAPAFASKNRSAPVSVMVSAPSTGGGQQLLSLGCTSSVGPPCFVPSASSWTYEVPSSEAGNFFLSFNFSTYHMNQDLFVSVNGGKIVEVGMFYTAGFWKQTQPLEVALVKGKNAVRFTRESGRDVMYKNFILSKTRPSIPKPPPSYIPTPAPAQNASSYIEVAAATTCVKQGIKPVSAEDCSHACLALGFKSTGPRARPNISGCFVMTTGQYAGNCNFNSNKSATCTPPCTLFGSVVRSLCRRV